MFDTDCRIDADPGMLLGEESVDSDGELDDDLEVAIDVVGAGDPLVEDVAVVDFETLVDLVGDSEVEGLAVKDKYDAVPDTLGEEEIERLPSTDNVADGELEAIGDGDKPEDTLASKEVVWAADCDPTSEKEVVGEAVAKGDRDADPEPVLDDVADEDASNDGVGVTDIEKRGDIDGVSLLCEETLTDVLGVDVGDIAGE